MAFVEKRVRPEKHSGEEVAQEMEQEYRASAGMGGSNNWVVHKEVSIHSSTQTSISGHSQSIKFSDTEGALMASDPHLEINRLPPIWYEVVLHKPDHDFVAGISVPVRRSKQLFLISTM